MQTHVSSTRTVTGSSRPVLTALGGTALALAVAAGVVLWRGTGQQDERTAPAVASLSAEPVAVESVGKVPGSNATLPEILNASHAKAPIIYITGSKEEAAWLRQFTAEVNRLAMAAGRPASSVTVLVAISPEDDAAIQAQIAQIHNVQQGIGLPVTQVFDLRAE